MTAEFLAISIKAFLGTGKMPVPQENLSVVERHLARLGTGKMPIPPENSSVVERASCPFRNRQDAYSTSFV